jgi:uncharacterized protein
MSPAHRRLLKIARYIHVYLTLFGLMLLAFFAVTGFMLNHEDWFLASESVKRTAVGTVPTQILQPADKLAIVELLRKDYAARGVVETCEVEEDSVRVVFNGPGRRIEAVMQKEDGKLEVTYEYRGAVGVLLDLHRGKATGTAWSLIIDGVCVLVLIVATTGLILWQSLRGRGHYGLLVLGLGLALGVGVYLLFVP